MPPEVFNHEPYNEKVDVYSFAVVLYELFGRTLLVYSEARCAAATSWNKEGGGGQHVHQGVHS